jgi:hypothetical protein
MDAQEIIARRIAQELRSGMFEVVPVFGTEWRLG